MSKSNIYKGSLLERARLVCGEFNEEALEFLEAMYDRDMEAEVNSKAICPLEENGLTDERVQAYQVNVFCTGEAVDINQMRVEKIKEAFLDLTLEPSETVVSAEKEVNNLLSFWSSFDLFEQISKEIKEYRVRSSHLQSVPKKICYMKREGKVSLEFSSSKQDDAVPFLSWSSTNNRWEEPVSLEADNKARLGLKVVDCFRDVYPKKQSGIYAKNVDGCIMSNFIKHSRSELE